MEPPHTYLTVRDEGFDQKVLEEASGLAYLWKWKEVKLRWTAHGLPRAEGGNALQPSFPSEVGSKR